MRFRLGRSMTGNAKMAMDVVDYEIKGAEMQFVEVELDPGEAAVGEPGSRMFMENGIVLDTIFGDGSQASSGLWGALVGAGKRLIIGAKVFTTCACWAGSAAC
jgi:uncharacterized protein (AIM24 family)